MSSASVPEEVLRNIKMFIAELKKEIRVEAVYLFGSYAKGDWKRGSDVDLIIVSRDFEEMNFIRRLDLVNDIAWRLRLRPPLEVIPLTPEELERGSVIVRDAKKYWVEIPPD